MLKGNRGVYGCFLIFSMCKLIELLVRDKIEQNRERTFFEKMVSR